MEVKNIMRNLLKSRNENESGYALIIVLGIVILTIGILSSMTLVTIADTKSSSNNRAVLATRIASESSLDTLYASINSGAAKDILTALTQLKQQTAPYTQIFDTTNDGPATTVNGVTTQNHKWSAYFGIDGTGTITACTSISTPCFKMRIIEKTSDGSSADIHALSGVGFQATKRQEFTIDVVSRSKCNGGTLTAPISCSYSRMQQNISKRQYVQFTSISQSESISASVKNAAIQSGVLPSALVSGFSDVNSYSSQDSVAGNIHTNDLTVKACDAFNAAVNSWITTGGSGSAGVAVNSGVDGCTHGPSAPKEATRLPLALPDRSGDTSAAKLKETADNDSAVYDITGTPNIVFNYNGTVNLPSGVKSMPPSGVIFLPNGGTISGTVSGKVTVASAIGTDITIGGNLKYAGGASVTNTHDLLGVYAGRDIIISCGRAITSTQPCLPIEVNGFLKANTDMSVLNNPNWGTIYNPNWAWSAPAAVGAAPTFKLFGAMESYYRGTFGSMSAEPGNNGYVVTGFVKSFTFDSRLVDEQPPYMLRDGTVPFIRSSIKDVPCENVCSTP